MEGQFFHRAKPFSSNPKEWQAELGFVPWDSHVVFTKESLVKFLKTLNIEVDTNMRKIRNLPQYATFGTLKDASASELPAPVPAAEETAPRSPQAQAPAAPAAATAADVSGPAAAPRADGWIPTRRVRELPGGGSAQIASLFGGDDGQSQERTSAAAAPAAPSQPPNPGTSSKGVTGGHLEDNPIPPPRTKVLMPDGSEFVPSRRVREPVGGVSTIGSILGGGGD